MLSMQGLMHTPQLCAMRKLSKLMRASMQISAESLPPGYCASAGALGGALGWQCMYRPFRGCTVIRHTSDSSTARASPICAMQISFSRCALSQSRVARHLNYLRPAGAMHCQNMDQKRCRCKGGNMRHWDMAPARNTCDATCVTAHLTARC